MIFYIARTLGNLFRLGKLMYTRTLKGKKQNETLLHCMDNPKNMSALSMMISKFSIYHRIFILGL